ncbi:HNH endonuclease [Gilvimarinus algae]|uniref:HNH endonuclease n=1 Tax=Gilvimarinus algae TaxID=3058037 RepID=A0ABT8TLB5_9GAMM|nr:hypothetical protein [Gilvimarinus sp. SDUM040014]MDO3383142.1 hypothetical protein [Gilvimarinus sp. SDUM040014]
MPSNIERLRAAIEEWLIRNDLDIDTGFYSIEEWRLRNEDYLNDSDLVLVFEGGLHTMLNFGGDTEEFDDYIESFGYYYEQGHSWNMGFYPIPDYDYTPLGGSYSQKLRDPRWKEKSKLVKERAGWKCQDCGGTDRLETHHCYYTVMREGNEPWEYPLSALRCLCHSCHEDRAKTESRIRAYMARLTNVQMKSLKEGLDSAFYWFEPDAVIDLLSKLGHSDEKVVLAINDLLTRRNETGH